MGRSLSHSPGNDILQSRAASERISQHICHLLFATCQRERERDRDRKRERLREETLLKVHFFVVAPWRKRAPEPVPPSQDLAFWQHNPPAQTK